MATNTNPFYTYSATAGSSKTLQKPQDGGDNNQWGNYINTDLDEIVSAVNALSDKIADANEKTLVDFTATTDAVNHVGITNAATGNGPTISTAGTDSNVDLNVTPKGTGDSVFTNKIKVDDVIEKTTDHGVEIEGVLVKDSIVKTDDIQEKTTDHGVEIEQVTLKDGNASFGDSKKAQFGAGNDLQIYHDGSNSYVDDAGTGRLYLRGNDRVQIQKYTGEDMVTASVDDGVKLYHDNAKKLETTSTGVTVTGTATVDTLKTGVGSESTPAIGVGDDDTGIFDAGANAIGFTNGGSESMRITGDSHFLFNVQTAPVPATSSPGTVIFHDAYLAHCRAGGTSFFLGRNTDDGTLLMFRREGVDKGNISVSGNTVSYNAFTGSHYGWINGSCEKGKVVIMTGNNQHVYDDINEEIIYGVEECSAENDSRFLGCYVALLNPSDEKTIGDEDNSPNPDLIMSVGNGVMWVVDEGSNITQGDNLITSTTQGHARKDPQTAPYSYVIGRAGEPVDWSQVSETVGSKKHKLISVLFDISTVKN